MKLIDIHQVEQNDIFLIYNKRSFYKSITLYKVAYRSDSGISCNIISDYTNSYRVRDSIGINIFTEYIENHNRCNVGFFNNYDTDNINIFILDNDEINSILIKSI